MCIFHVLSKDLKSIKVRIKSSLNQQDDNIFVSESKEPNESQNTATCVEEQAVDNSTSQR